jgi:hypothetical protein
MQVARQVRHPRKSKQQKVLVQKHDDKISEESSGRPKLFADTDCTAKLFMCAVISVSPRQHGSCHASRVPWVLEAVYPRPWFHGI